MNLTLAVSHILHLTEEQRYALNDGKEVELVGISVPVWCYNGETSEPANEVFCKYKLTPTNCTTNIKYLDDCSYQVELAKNFHNEKDEKVSPTVMKNLLNGKDGGSEWLAFRQYNKVKKNKKMVNMAHFVEIKDMKTLLETIM